MGPAPQHGASSRHAQGRLCRSLGQAQAGKTLARHGEEPLQGWSLLLGRRLCHPIFEQGRISGYQSVRNRAEPGMKAVRRHNLREIEGGGAGIARRA